MAPKPTQTADQQERQRQEAMRRSAGGSTYQPSAADVRAMQNAGMQGTLMTGGAPRTTTVSSAYPRHYSGISSPHYPTNGMVAPQAQMGTSQAGQWYYDPMAQVFINRTTGQRQRNSPFVSASIQKPAANQNAKAYTGIRSAETWSGGSKVGTGAGYGGAGGKGGKTKIDPNTGKALPSLPPELERWYQEQLSRARTEEEQAMAQARLARRAALLQAAEERRAARRQAAGQAVDVGAAMAGLGLGTSPALLGAALDQVYGTGAAGALSAEAARSAALEQFLRDEQSVMDTGRRKRTDLEDWRALQVAALSNADLAKLIQGSPLGGRG